MHFAIFLAISDSIEFRYRIMNEADRKFESFAIKLSFNVNFSEFSQLINGVDKKIEEVNIFECIMN